MTPKRKNRPGAGRPRAGRTANLPRIRPEVYADLKAIAAVRQMTIANTIEFLIDDAMFWAKEDPY